MLNPISEGAGADGQSIERRATEIAVSGAELRYALVEMAGLQPETSYDRDIGDQVGRALKLGWGSHLGEEIERAGSDTTDVLVASSAPFSHGPG